jgi:hypothetical protein
VRYVRFLFETYTYDVAATTYYMMLDNLQLTVEEMEPSCPSVLSFGDSAEAPAFTASSDAMTIQQIDLCTGWPGGQLVFTSEDMDPDTSENDPEVYHGVPDANFPSILKGYNITDNLTDSTSQDINPALSHDGYQMAFLSDRESPGTYQLFLASYGGFNARRIPIPVNPSEYSQLSWSPSNDQIAFSDGTDIHIADLTRKVTLGPLPRPAGSISAKNPAFHPTNPDYFAYVYVDGAGTTQIRYQIGTTEADLFDPGIHVIRLLLVIEYCACLY